MARNLLKDLAGAKFMKVWKGKDYEEFFDFLTVQAIPAGGFLVSFPMEGGSLGWFFFKIEDLCDKGNGDFEILWKNSAAIPTPDNPSCRECPEEWKGYPVRRLL